MSSIPRSDSVEDLSWFVRDLVRELRLFCTGSGRALAKQKHSIFPEGATQLLSMARSFHSVEELLTRLNNEITLAMPGEDLDQLCFQIDDKLYTVQTTLSLRVWALPEDIGEEIKYDLDNISRHTETLAEQGARLGEEILATARLGHGTTGSGPSTRAQLHEQLVVHLATEGGTVCPICLETMISKTPTDPTITKCGHVFCNECINTWVNDFQKCPMCRRRLPAYLLFK